MPSRYPGLALDAWIFLSLIKTDNHQGASLADVAVLVVAAPYGEYEAGISDSTLYAGCTASLCSI
jgi:hypothetical protein